MNNYTTPPSYHCYLCKKNHYAVIKTGTDFVCKGCYDKKQLCICGKTHTYAEKLSLKSCCEKCKMCDFSAKKIYKGYNLIWCEACDSNKFI